jgi:hypothetical protein
MDVLISAVVHNGLIAFMFMRVESARLKISGDGFRCSHY